MSNIIDLTDSIALNLVIQKDQSILKTIQCYNTDGSNFDFSIYTNGVFTVREQPTSTDSLLVLSGSSFQLLTGGIIRMEFDNSLPVGRYYYTANIQLTTGDWRQLLRGQLNVLDESNGDVYSNSISATVKTPFVLSGATIVNPVTGATNLGNLGLFTSTANNKIQLKGLKAGSNITLTPTSTGITISSSGSATGATYAGHQGITLGSLNRFRLGGTLTGTTSFVGSGSIRFGHTGGTSVGPSSSMNFGNSRSFITLGPNATHTFTAQPDALGSNIASFISAESGLVSAAHNSSFAFIKIRTNTGSAYTGNTLYGFYYNPSGGGSGFDNHIAATFASGNVGIGLLKPTHKLEVSGNTLLNGNIRLGKISTNGYVWTATGSTGGGSWQTTTGITANYLLKSSFNNYSGTTQTNINNKLSISAFNSYSASTGSLNNNKLNTSVYAAYTASTGNRITAIESNYVTGLTSLGNNSLVGSKVGKNLTVKGLAAGSNITLTPTSTGITISSTGGGSSSNGVTGTTQTQFNLFTGQTNQYLKPYGTVYTDNFNRANGAPGANYTKVGSTFFSITSNQLRVSGGTGTLNDYLMRSDSKTNLDSFERTVDVTIGTVNSTSYGIGLGLQSQGHSTQLFSIQYTINLSTAGQGGGEIYWYSQSTASNSGNFASYSQTSNSRLLINTGNQLQLKLIRNKNVFTAIVKNISTGYVIEDTYIIESHYPYGQLGAVQPNVSYHSLYNLGGSYNISNDTVTSQSVIGADWLLVGDSIAAGYHTTNINHRWFDQLAKSYLGSYEIYAGVGNRIEDGNTTEILNLKPKKLLLHAGTNNYTVGDTSGTTVSKIDNFVKSITGGSSGYVVGTNFFIGLLLPRNTVDVTPVNVWIKNRYSSTGWIDFYTPMRVYNSTTYHPFVTPDGIHPNQWGHSRIANYFAKIMGLTPRVNDAPFSSPLYRWLDPATGGRAQLTFLSSTAVDVLAASRENGDVWYNGTNLYFNRNGVLVDMAGVGSATSGLRASNGVVRLGGVLSGATNIGYGTSVLNFTGTTGQARINGNAIVFAGQNGLRASNGVVRLGGVLSGATTIGLVANNLTITGTTGTLRYGADYSANYNVRSVVDKGYVTGFTLNQKTFLGKQIFAAPTTSNASMNIPSGATVSSPNNGDLWIDSTGAIKIRIGGVTKTITVS